MADKDDDELVAAVERYLEVCFGISSDTTLTDVLLVTVRRGFDHQGGKSKTSVLVPSDSSVPILMGMARYAQLRFDDLVRDSFEEDKAD